MLQYRYSTDAKLLGSKPPGAEGLLDGKLLIDCTHAKLVESQVRSLSFLSLPPVWLSGNFTHSRKYNAGAVLHRFL